MRNTSESLLRFYLITLTIMFVIRKTRTHGNNISQLNFPSVTLIFLLVRNPTTDVLSQLMHTTSHE